MLDFFKLLKQVKEIKPRITPTTAILMFIFNLIFDALAWLFKAIVIGVVTNPIMNYAVIFITGLWLRLNKVDVMKPKGMTTSIASFIIEMIPFINLLPALTANVVIHITTSWAEDLAAQTKGTLAGAVPGGGTLAKAADATGVTPTQNQSGQGGTLSVDGISGKTSGMPQSRPNEMQQERERQQQSKQLQNNFQSPQGNPRQNEVGWNSNDEPNTLDLRGNQEDGERMAA